MEYRCYLSLGANLGERGETLREALRRIAALPVTLLEAVSPFYETAPWGKLDQPSFLNAAATVLTSLAPRDFLHACQSIERDLGRVRHETGAPEPSISIYCPSKALHRMTRNCACRIPI